jgi:hypothetical protein
MSSKEAYWKEIFTAETQRIRRRDNAEKPVVAYSDEEFLLIFSGRSLEA